MVSDVKQFVNKCQFLDILFVNFLYYKIIAMVNQIVWTAKMVE